MPTLHIHLLGEFHLRYDDTAIELSSPRQQSLLGYLLLHRRAPQARQQIAFALWPESGERQGRTNLRRELHHLRRALPDVDRFLHVDNSSLHWQPDAPFTLDVAALERAIDAADAAQKADDVAGERAALEQAVEQYGGELLPRVYDEWIQPERERLARRYVTTLERLIDLLETQRAYRPAINHAQRLLRHDPLREATYRQLMRLHARNGDRARALRVYHTCVTTLQQELGVEPDPATRQAHECLLNVQPQPHNGTPPTIRARSHLVGRQAEWKRLQSAWQRAARGEAHVIIVAGEAGIGKSRLVEELADWTARRGITTARARSYAVEGRLAYAPMAEWLRTRALRSTLSTLDDVWLMEIARLLPELLSEQPSLIPPQPLSGSGERQRLFQALSQAICINGKPLLLVLDDMQWTDRETLEWLHYLLRSNPQHPLLIAGTIRSAEIAADHPLRSLLRSLRSDEQLSEIELGPLDAVATTTLAASVAGRDLSAQQASRLYAETEGNPLFIVETVRADSGGMERKSGTVLPPKVQAVIESRLAQLSTHARQLADLAATVGRSFTFEVLMQASEWGEDALVQGLDELWQRRLIRERNEHEYDFSHDKIREVAYASLSTANHHRLHHLVAEALEALHEDDLDPISSQVAEHYAQAGYAEQAIKYYTRAGHVAQKIYAHEEAARLFTNALALLEEQPARAGTAEQELALRLALATSIRITKGYAASELDPNLHRAQALCKQMEDPAQLPHVLYGLFSFSFVRAEFHKVYALGEQLLSLAEQFENPTFYTQAHHTLGASLYGMGQFERACDHLTQGAAYYKQEQHNTHVALFGADLGVFCQAWLAHPLWHLGYPEQARQSSQESLALAEELEHPFSRALALCYAAMLHQFRREPQVTKEHATAAIAICQEHSISYYNAWSAMLHGWACAQVGEMDAGMDELQRNLDKFKDSEAVVRLPYYHSLLVTLYADAGDIDAGWATLEEALKTAHQQDEPWWNAELHRLRGVLMCQAGDEAEAEASLKQAVTFAHQQSARSLELRSCIALCRLWWKQGKRVAACDMLEPIYRGFTEGFDTPDLQEARKLLDRLSS